jgi:uncharacterized protein (DUF58 family)
VQTHDFLGIFILKRRSKAKMQLTVYPRIAEIEDLPLSLSLMSQSFSRYVVREEDYSTVSDVRPYNSADSMKRIHWKLSAKKLDLMVKNYETTALNSTSVFLDPGKCGSNPPESCALGDKLVETAVACGYFCLKKQMPVILRFSRSGAISASNMMDFDNIYQELAHMDFEGDSLLPQMLASFMNEQASPVNATVVTSRLSEELLDILAKAHHFGHHMILAYVRPFEERELEKSIYSMLAEMGIICVSIGPDDELADVF